MILAALVSSKALCIGIGDEPYSGKGEVKAHFRRSYIERMEILIRSPNIFRPNKRRACDSTRWSQWGQI